MFYFQQAVEEIQCVTAVYTIHNMIELNSLTELAFRVISMCNNESLESVTLSQSLCGIKAFGIIKKNPCSHHLNLTNWI
jgi:hypothetical protein